MVCSEWAVGRRKKFGEESGFVNVRVPKSKVSEYRDAIKKLVEDKFSRDAQELQEEEHVKGSFEKENVQFRDFREFGRRSEEKVAIKAGEDDDFIEDIFKEVEIRRKDKKQKD